MSKELKNLINQKGNGADCAALCRRRVEANVQLRKDRRINQQQQHRNIHVNSDKEWLVDMDEKQESSLDIITKAYSSLFSESSNAQLKGLREIAKVMTGSQKLVSEFVSTGMVTRVVEFLRHFDSMYSLEAANVLSALITASPARIEALITTNAIPAYVQLLKSNSSAVVAESLWALGNIAAESRAYRDNLLDAGVMIALVKFVEKTYSTAQLQDSVWVMSNLCCGKSPLADFEKTSVCMPSLGRFIVMCDKTILEFTLWCLSNLSRGSSEQVQKVIDAQFLPRLVELLGHSSADVLLPCIQVIMNITCGTDEQIRHLIDHKALPRLVLLLGSSQSFIVMETCVVISNIASGNVENFRSLVDVGVFHSLVSSFNNADFKVKKVAARAMVNATFSSEHIQHLVDVGCIPCMCELLSVNDSDAVFNALEGLFHVLKAGKQQKDNSYACIIEENRGREKIEMLQYHEQRQVAELAGIIVDQYFEEDESEAVFSAPHNELSMEF